MAFLEVIPYRKEGTELTAEGRSRRELAHCTAVSGLMSEVSGKVGPWLLECSRRLWPWRYFLQSSVGKRLAMVRPQADRGQGRGWDG